MGEHDFLVRNGHWVILVVGLILFVMRMKHHRRGQCAKCSHCNCKCAECLPKPKNPPK